MPISRVSTVIVCCVPSEGSAVSPLLRHGEAFHALHVFTRDVCAAQGRPRPSRHGGTLRPRSQTASDTNAARRLNVPGAKANKALGRRSELGWPQKQMTAGRFRLPRTHRAAAARRMGTASALGGGMRAGRATRNRSRRRFSRAPRRPLQRDARRCSPLRPEPPLQPPRGKGRTLTAAPEPPACLVGGADCHPPLRPAALLCPEQSGSRLRTPLASKSALYCVFLSNLR